MSAGWVRGTTYWTTRYTRTWRGTLMSSFLRPVLFLAAMGKGLGSLVDANSSVAHRLGGVDYVTFLGPGLLATSTLMVASQEAMWPVQGSVRWDRAYVAMCNAPLSPGDAMWGHFAYMTFRSLSVATTFVVVMLAFGAIHSPLVLLAIPAAALCGMSMAAPIAAYSVTLDTDGGFAALNRFVITPMSLFAGAFFPVSQLPSAIRPIAYVTPMWHGVDLCRSFALGTASLLPTLGHIAFLVAFAGVGAAIALPRYRRVLTP